MPGAAACILDSTVVGICKAEISDNENFAENFLSGPGPLAEHGLLPPPRGSDRAGTGRVGRYRLHKAVTS